MVRKEKEGSNAAVLILALNHTGRLLGVSSVRKGDAPRVIILSSYFRKQPRVNTSWKQVDQTNASNGLPTLA